MLITNKKIKIGEKIGYALGDGAANIAWRGVATFLFIFYTDVFGISPAAVGILMLIARFSDGIIDIIMGILCDRTNSKYGKFRPWILWTAVPLGITLSMLFTTPHLGTTGKIVYAYATYLLFFLIYTANNIPYGALMAVMTGDDKERTSIGSYRMVGAFTGGMVVQGALLFLVAYFGNIDPNVRVAKLAAKEYKITVVKDGFLAIEATSVIEPAPGILKYTILRNKHYSGRADVTITFKDPAGVKNYYRLVVKNEDEFSEKPDWAQNKGNSSGAGWIYSSNPGFWSTDPNLNWDNGSSSSGVFDDVPINIFHIFNDDLIDGKEYSLSFSYSLSAYPEANNRTIIYLQAITEDLHKYLKTYSAQYYYGDDFLLEPIQVYTNVKNGGGILGSYNANKFIVNVDDLVIK